MRPILWVVGTALLTGLALLSGVGLAAVLAQSGSPGSWSKWSDVGQTFGALSSIISGLALGAVVVFSLTQQRELRRSAAADLSMLHLEILKLSITDDKLAEVWPAFQPGLSPEKNRQYLYATIIYQFHWTSLRLDGATTEEVLRSMRYLFTSPIMRDYWAATERGRRSLAPGSPEYIFADRVDAICRDFEAAVASAKSPAEQPMPA